jgi:hypothetical protein
MMLMPTREKYGMGQSSQRGSLLWIDPPVIDCAYGCQKEDQKEENNREKNCRQEDRITEKEGEKRT